MRVLTLALLVALAGQAKAQVPQEITFFSNTGMSGGRFTVTGPRTNLALPYIPRSAALQGGGSWQVCSSTNYSGRCQVVASNQLALNFGQIRSIRPLAATFPTPGSWREIARLNVRDRAERDIAYSSDQRTLFRELKVCAQRSTIRIRRAEAQLGNGTWQRLFVPAAIREGECSNPIGLIGGSRRVRAVRFEYEAWSIGMRRGIMSVQALPSVRPQPR